MNAAIQAAIASLGSILATRASPTTSVSDISTMMSSFASVAQTLGTNTTLPSVVNSNANALVAAAGNVAQLIAANPSDTVPSLEASSTYQAVIPAASALFVSALAASVASDVATNGCTGYSTQNVALFQGAAGLSTATAGQYDSITAAAVRAALAASSPMPIIPAACAAGSGNSSVTTPTTTTTTTTTTAPAAAAPMSTAAVIGITVASVAAVGTLGYLLMKNAPAAAKAVVKSNPRRRRRA
jgi:hypothetical protein